MFRQAVVPEILEPSLHLAAAVLTRLEWNGDECRESVSASVRCGVQSIGVLLAQERKVQII